MPLNIGEPVPTPRVKRDRPRDPEAVEVMDLLLQSPEGFSIPVTGFADEEDARRFGGRVQGYANRDHDATVRTTYHRDSGTLYLTLEDANGHEESATG